jgi:hypothetical protein
MTVRHTLLFTLTFAGLAVCTTAVHAQLVTSTEGRPATTADLAGKKLCWDIGYWDIYAANGDYLSIRSPKPHLKWSISEPGVVRTGSTYWRIQILPDGQFYLERFCGHCASNYEHWAKVCN